MRNPIIRNTALFLMTSAMEDHQRKLAKEIETKRLEEEKAKKRKNVGPASERRVKKGPTLRERDPWRRFLLECFD